MIFCPIYANEKADNETYHFPSAPFIFIKDNDLFWVGMIPSLPSAESKFQNIDVVEMLYE